MSQPKPLEFLGTSLDDLRAFPENAMRQAGYQLNRVQHGLEPSDCKPMKEVGKGVWEIRVWDQSGTYRVMYVAKFADAVYVLHCFQKKAQATTKADLDLTAKRYRDLVRELKK